MSVELSRNAPSNPIADGMDPEDFNNLIPELQDWNEGQGIDAESWIQCIGNFEHAIGYTQLFWPEFVLHRGYILRKGFTEENLDGFIGDGSSTRTQVEAVMNHIHIVNLFGVWDPAATPSIEQILYLGRTLREMWEVKLKRDFPDEHLTVSFNEEPCDDLLDYQLTVYHTE